MRLLRPLIRWMFLFAVLTAIGAVTFQVVRYRPRCTLRTSSIDTVHLSADGGHLLRHDVPGPVSVWDTHNGSLVHELFADPGVRHLRTSPRESVAAAILGDD
jgi:hypothetical protein